jgi:hypothetical protein
MGALAFFVAKYMSYRPAQWIATRRTTMLSLIPDFAVQVFNFTHSFMISICNSVHGFIL